MTDEARHKRVVPGSAAAGLGMWLAAFGAQVLFESKTVAAICLVVGIVLFLFAAVSSDAAQRHVPALGRIPLVHDHRYTTVAKRSAGPREQPTLGANAYTGARELQQEYQANALKVATAEITEELEHGEHVLAGSDAPEFFVNHNLADRKWKEHSAKLAEHPNLHRRVRTAYRAIDALNNRGVRRGVVTSKGRKTTLIDPDRSREARDAISAAVNALEEFASTGQDVSGYAVITGDVRALLLRLAASGRTVFGQANSLFSRSIAESMVGDWTEEAADALHNVSADLAEGFLRVAEGNGPDALEARIRFLEESAEEHTSEG